MVGLYAPPADVFATVWSRLPEEFRITDSISAWAAANKPGHVVDCFLEGPSFDVGGNLWLVDIPWGRIFKVSPGRKWTQVVRYDGWPNGLAIHRDGRVFIADYAKGILVLDPHSGAIETLLSHHYSEGFHGCNDLTFADNGDLYFTDQGQSGLHRADGRVFRLSVSGRLECILSGCPSPNGLVMSDDQSTLYVAMTRANNIWRVPLMADGGVSKVGAFIQLSGGLSGPDGMALDSNGGPLVAHAGMGAIWTFSALGEPIERIHACAGLSTTNIAFGGLRGNELFITESDTGNVLRATLERSGRTLFSHR
jgi:gluconolactonase